LESKLKKTYNRWNNNINKAKFIQKCKKLNDAFYELNELIKSNVNKTLLEDKDGQKRLNVVENLYSVWRKNKIDLFRRWKEINGKLRIKEKLNDTRK
jgi:hypothetical protein